MFVLGVTGGIGSGKSAATDIFSSLGIKIVDADVLSRVPVQKGQAGLFGSFRESPRPKVPRLSG